MDPRKDAIKAMPKPSNNPKDSIYAAPAMDKTSSEGIGEINDCKIIAKISPNGPNCIVIS